MKSFIQEKASMKFPYGWYTNCVYTTLYLRNYGSMSFLGGARFPPPSEVNLEAI